MNDLHFTQAFSTIIVVTVIRGLPMLDVQCRSHKDSAGDSPHQCAILTMFFFKVLLKAVNLRNLSKEIFIALYFPGEVSVPLEPITFQEYNFKIPPLYATRGTFCRSHFITFYFLPLVTPRSV